MCGRVKESVMGQETKHTPLPWKHVRQRASDDSHDIVAPRETGGIIVATCGCQGCDDGIVAGNAELIARACNSYEQLLSVLQAIVREADYDQADERMDLGQRLLSIEALAKAAIAAAGKEQT